MSLAAIIAFAQTHSATLLGLWVLFEQYLASNKKIKANSTLQLILGVIRALVKSTTKGNAGK